MMQASRWVGGATLNQSSHYSDIDKLWNGGRGERRREREGTTSCLLFAKKISFIGEH